nr:ATP synthase F0 subunit 8 [Neodanuria bolauana]
MPQMMPLNWIMLLCFFSFMLISFNVLNYYSIINKSNLKKKLNLNMKKIIWKW